ncbi:hypothetical protein ABZW18_20090 [Streptomyces sp. NPDC004647]|uniref:hypothetical protein n=1 Tax=Streptomyces sp. NPDC004647 TaxID=3154671 RepID=UPI0033A1EF60
MQPARLAPSPSGHQSRTDPRGGPAARPLLWLAGLAVVFTLAQLVLVAPGMGLGWDESVYISQVGSQAPAAFFSAPRARGITFLVAPVAGLTTSVDALRVYLSVLSGCGLLLSLWVWRRLLPVVVVLLAGALFGGLWITLFYGPQAMPNLWVAYAALLATGCFLRAVRDPADRRALTGLFCAVVFAALMRPADALWLAAPLAVAALCVRAWRRPAVLLALAAGAALGCAPWIIEAYVGYGGLAARLRRAGEIQGGMGWKLAFDAQLRAIEGRSLCRPCDVPWRHPATAAWWFALPLLTAGGVLAAARIHRLAVALVPALAGISLAVPYLLLIDYAAPRFLLPTYALLALPVALCLFRLVTGARPQLRPLVVAAVVLALAGHYAVQYAVLHVVASRSRETREAVGRIAAELHREGLRPPCTVSGEEAVRIAFRTGCSSRQIGGHDGSITRAGLLEAAGSRPVAVLVAGDRAAPSYTHGWRVQELPRLGGRAGFRAYLSPSAQP